MPESGAPILSCRGITVRFGGVTALDGVDFEARPGRITAVIGPNGAGKTTLFNAITGMVRADEGRVLMCREDITAMEPHGRGQAGIVRTFQNLEIFTNMSVLENVMTGAHRRVGYGILDCLLRTPRFLREEARCRREAMERLAFVGLDHRADHPSGDLAFGLQRLLEIARAIASAPDVLLLDEPAAGLNMRETRELGRLVRRIRDELGVSIVLVEHDMDLVMNISDRIMVLNHGRVIAEGEPLDVQRHPEVVRAYLGEDDDFERQGYGSGRA